MSADLDPLEEELLEAFRKLRTRARKRSSREKTNDKSVVCALFVELVTFKTIGGSRAENLQINMLDGVSSRSAEA